MCTSSVPRTVSLLQRATTTSGFRLKVSGDPWRSTSTDEVVSVMLNLMEDMSGEEPFGKPVIPIVISSLVSKQSVGTSGSKLVGQATGRRDRCQAVTCLLSFLAVSRQIPMGLMCFGLMVWLVNGLKEGFSLQEQGRHQEADVLIGEANGQSIHVGGKGVCPHCLS